MAFEIVLDAAPENHVTELSTQLMQYEPPLFIQMAVEQVDGLVVITADNGALIARARLAQVGVQVTGNPVFVLVRAKPMLPLQVFEVGRETLVQPSVRPIATGDEVP